MHLSYHRFVRMICVDFSVDHLVFEAAAVASVFTYWANNFLCPSSWWAIIFSCVGTLLLQGHIGATEASERCLGWPCLFCLSVLCHYITGRRPVSMRVFIALVLETYVCFYRRCMKRRQFGPPFGHVPGSKSQVPGFRSCRSHVPGLSSKVPGARALVVSCLRSQVSCSGAMSQVSGPRFQVLGPRSQVPGPTSAGPSAVPSSHVLACDYWTDIQIIAGPFHRHDRKLLLAAWCLFYVPRQRRKLLGRLYGL